MLAESEILLRLLVAAAFGLIVGFEREAAEKPAGLRTHAIIAIGACLFTIVGVQLAETGVADLDATRIAAGVVTGIGFLGAGALFRSESHIVGLTTAAGIWAVGAIGVAAGLGYFISAGAATVLVFAVLDSGRLYRKLKGKK